MPLHQPRSDLLPPPSLIPQYTTADSAKADARNSSIALGVIVTLFLTSLIYWAYIRLHRRRYTNHLHNIAAQNYSARAWQPIERKSSRWSSISWGGSGRSSVALVNETPAQRERRWWGSVAAHGSTSKADANIEVREPEPVVTRACDEESPEMYTVNGYDWEVLQETQRVDGFRGVVWNMERMGAGLDQGAQVWNRQAPRPMRKRSTI